MAKPTYSQLTSLAGYGVLRNRVAAAVVKYAEYLNGTMSPTTTAFYTRIRQWISSALVAPDAEAGRIMHVVVRDPVFSDMDPYTDEATASGAVSDATLQGVVESAINRTA